MKEPSFIASVFLSLYGWVLVILSTVLFHVTGLIIFPFSLIFDPKTRYLMHGIAVLWARFILVTSILWKLRVEGREKVAAGRPYVIIANHQSLLDILVALAGIPVPFKFLAKKELFSIPFLGWHLGLAGYIPIDRSSHESGRKALLEARQWLRRGVSVLFFPEGTRSRDGEVHEFKPGAFKLAQDEGAEILPVVIDGTGQAVPKKSWRVAKNTQFLVSIGKPVSMAGASLEGKRDAVRKEMIERLKRFRAGA